MTTLIKRFILIVLSLVPLSMAQAEQMQRLSDWDVHYIVFPSTFVEPDIAKAYQFQRSKYQAIINISVLEHQSQKALMMPIEGTATDLLGRVQNLTFRQIKEGDAIYYLASLKNDDSQVWRFKIDIGPANNRQTLKFQEKVWIE